MILFEVCFKWKGNRKCFKIVWFMWISNILNIFFDSDIVVIRSVLKLFDLCEIVSWEAPKRKCFKIIWIMWINIFLNSDIVVIESVLKLFWFMWISNILNIFLNSDAVLRVNVLEIVLSIFV